MSPQFLLSEWFHTALSGRSLFKFRNTRVDVQAMCICCECYEGSSGWWCSVLSHSAQTQEHLLLPSLGMLVLELNWAFVYIPYLSEDWEVLKYTFGLEPSSPSLLFCILPGVLPAVVNRNKRARPLMWRGVVPWRSQAEERLQLGLLVQGTLVSCVISFCSVSWPGSSVFSCHKKRAHPLCLRLGRCSGLKASEYKYIQVSA